MSTQCVACDVVIHYDPDLGLWVDWEGNCACRESDHHVPDDEEAGDPDE